MPTKLRMVLMIGVFGGRHALKDTPIRGQAASHKASALVQRF